MFTVTFSNSKNVVKHVVFSVPTIEAAVSCALSLHNSSNVPHVVSVVDADGVIALTFTKVDASGDSAKKA